MEKSIQIVPFRIQGHMFNTILEKNPILPVGIHINNFYRTKTAISPKFQLFSIKIAGFLKK